MPTTKTALDPSTVSAPRCLDGLEVSVDSRITVSAADVMVVVFSSIVVCDPERRVMDVTESDFILNA